MATCREISHLPDRFRGGEGVGSTQAVSLTAFSQFFFDAFPLEAHPFLPKWMTASYMYTGQPKTSCAPNNVQI